MHQTRCAHTRMAQPRVLVLCHSQHQEECSPLLVIVYHCPNMQAAPCSVGCWMVWGLLVHIGLTRYLCLELANGSCCRWAKRRTTCGLGHARRRLLSYSLHIGREMYSAITAAGLTAAPATEATSPMRILGVVVAKTNDGAKALTTYCNSHEQPPITRASAAPRSPSVP